MPISTRLMLALFSALPLFLLKDALQLGWFSTPFGRPYTRRWQPGAYWASVAVCATVALGLLLAAILV